jgi:hypothetical protein
MPFMINSNSTNKKQVAPKRLKKKSAQDCRDCRSNHEIDLSGKESKRNLVARWEGI